MTTEPSFIPFPGRAPLPELGGRIALLKEYPVLVAGTLLGLGAVVGGIAHRVFGHRATAFELLGVKARRAESYLRKRIVSGYR